ncbi:MAG: hypothetical protein ACKV2U_01410 [Bryobacteraceae bacterium]
MSTRFDEMPKAMKREIRHLAGVVHERLLAAELKKLEREFARWDRKELDAFELAAAIHRFHEGAPRRLLSAFNTNRVEVLLFRVRDGVEEGTLKEVEIGEELLALLRTLTMF